MPQSSTLPIPIYTIGYGERTLAAFIALLQRYRIAYLVDVRTAPYSRFKPEFSKTQLVEALRQAEIKYIFMGDQLGGRPTDPACYTEGYVDYEKVAATVAYQQGLVRLRTAFIQQQRIALMCSEGRPEQCHRSKLIGESLTQQTIPIVHIDEADEEQSQASIIARLTDGQLSLFGDHAFQSRKRYGPRQQDASSNDRRNNREEWVEEENDD